jgi:hypothetical protein
VIQTETRGDDGEIVKLDPSDLRYWNGPYRYVPYPKQLFKAADGRYQDSDLETCIVKSEAEHRRLSSDWQESPDAARAHYDQMQDEFARAAAETAAALTTMSAKAQAEHRALEVASDDHVVDVPAPRKRRPGPKTKAEKAALAAVKDTP